MKTLIALIILTCACAVHAAPKVPPAPKQYGCSLHKVQDTISIKCGDKSVVPLAELFPQPIAAPAAEAPKSLHIKDATGTEFKNLIHMTATGQVNETVVNMTTGNVLSYDANGALTTITRTFYESADCSGVMYAYPSSGQSLKNRILTNVSASPQAADAFKITGFASGYVALHSKFEAGSCTVYNASVNQLTLVEPTAFNSQDPLTIALPLELIFN